MLPSDPGPLPPALREDGLAEWHQFHQDAMARMSDLALALDHQGWPGVERACRWVHEAFHPHNQWEEQRLFPLLERVGRGQLGEQLKLDHLEMGDLTQAILDGSAGGMVADPSPHGLRARRLLDLVRQHIDTEVHCMLPLLQGQGATPADAPAGEGYLTTPGRSAAASGCPGCAPPGTCSGSAPDRPAGAAPG